ncbi:hypothetical protein N0V90_004177 [Kalmusia sp. IMI 367209]|nr:hypothetical protein N0V90_004177 [Kalmusia sp. IMI 367209]
MEPDIEIVRVKHSSLVQVSQYCPECPIVEVAVPNHVHEVKKVVLKTISHDQGWCSQHSEPWTWFDVIIAAETQPVEPRPEFKWPESRRLRFYHNDAGNPNFQERTTILSLESNDTSERGWLSSICPGDRIQILPRAKFLRWVNFVREVELEVSWTSKAANISESPSTSRKMPIYFPLDSDRKEIRLLEIQPGQLGDPLICALMYTSISDPENNVPYTALSYCWGSRKEVATMALHVAMRGISPEEPRQIFEVQVQANLHNALKHLCRERGAPRIVWVDAVAMMRDIYVGARDVCIWLGEGDDKTPATLSNINLFAAAFRKDPQGFLENTNQNMERPHGQTSIGSLFYGSVSRLFNFPWFTRVWVLQEVFNARTATVQIGKESLPWDLVMCIGNCMIKAKQRARAMGNLTIPDIFLSLFEVRKEFNRMSVVRRYDKDILALLVHGLDMGATDPRDKVFALMGLREEADRLYLQDEVQPDYSKQISQVFSDFTRWWIRANRSLRILSTVHATLGRTWQRMSTDKSPELPNDRPTWSMWHTGSSSWAKSTLAYDMDCSYRACGPLVLEPKILENPSASHLLSLEGIQIGFIRDIRPYQWGNTYGTGVDDLTEAFEKIFDPAGILGPWTPGGTTAHVARPDKYVQMTDHLIAHEESATENGGVIPCISRCLFSGRGLAGEELTGLCPYTARIGDIIVVLIGGNVPFLIRRQPFNDDTQDIAAQYGFVGECFVQRYMNGRAIDEWRNGQLRMEQFQLA